MNELPIDALVNKNNLLSSDYYPKDLIITDQNENNFHEFQDPRLKPMVSKVIWPYMEKMFDDAKKAGFVLAVDSGYRSYNYQQKVLDKLIEEVGDVAYQKVALPGASEHQTGLAFDYGYYRDDKFYSSDYVREEDPEGACPHHPHRHMRSGMYPGTPWRRPGTPLNLLTVTPQAPPPSI